jgi:UDP-N-acetylmuramoyl-L-alanyl-D-glutamate--2,6-diaminopimelate ligase
VDNLLAVIGSLRALGVSLADAVQSCAHLTAVPGRMQRVMPDAGDQALPLTLVDYAHTPDAVSQALSALRSQAQVRGGRLWCVLGCGGDRDAGKRPLMAAAAEAVADHVVLTSDNPRSESPEVILKAMQAGLRQPEMAQIQVDRAVAIAEAVMQAAPADVILIAGKGHETTQEIMGVRHPFSDVSQVQSALQQRAEKRLGVAA